MSERDELLVEGRKLHAAWFDGPDMEQRDRMIRMATVAREIHKPRTIQNADLCQLSDGSYRTDHKAGTIVKSLDGSVWRFDEGDWDCLDWVSASLLGPGTVLYEPTA